MDADMQNATDEEKERKAAIAWQKMEEMNQKLRKRYQEIEEDRKSAEATNSSITTAVVTNSFESKTPEKSFDEEEWRAERSKIDEERSARASANSQREWDMDKFKQGDESGPEMRFERNYRRGKPASSSGSWGRKFGESRPHENDYGKSYRSNANNYSKDRGSFRDEQRFSSGNERTFNYQKQERGRNYGGSGNWEHDSSQHDSDTHISSKVFERTDERSENRYGRRSNNSQPFRRSDSYRQNRHGDFRDSGLSIKQNEDRQTSYGNRQPFNRTVQNNQRRPRHDTWSGDESHEQQNNFKATHSREQPKMRQNSYAPTSYKKENYNKSENQSSHLSTKAYSYSKTRSDSVEPIVAGSQQSGTWSDCNDNATSRVSQEHSINAGSHLDPRAKHNSVVRQTSGTWSDCEDDKNNSQVHDVSHADSRTKSNAVAVQSSGTWSDCDDDIASPKVSNVHTEDYHGSQKNHENSPLKSPTKFDNVNSQFSPREKPFSQGKATHQVECNIEKGNNNNNMCSSSWSDCEQDNIDTQKDLTKEHLYNRKPNTYRNERYGRGQRNTNQIQGRRGAGFRPVGGISTPKPAQYSKGSAILPPRQSDSAMVDSKVGINNDMSSKKKSRSFIENPSDYDHSDWEYEELNYWEDLPDGSLSEIGFENKRKNYNTSNSYSKRSNARNRSSSNYNVKPCLKSPQNRIVQSGPNNGLVITKTVENDGSWESLSD